MRKQKSKAHTEEQTAKQIALLREADAGHLERLECPSCGLLTVSVWFTNPARDEYRTWFLCANCEFHARARNEGKPKYYSGDRFSAELNERDAAILKGTHFPKPPQKVM